MTLVCPDVNADVVLPVELRCWVVCRGILDVVCSNDDCQTEALLVVGDDCPEQILHGETLRGYVHVENIEVNVT